MQTVVSHRCVFYVTMGNDLYQLIQTHEKIEPHF